MSGVPREMRETDLNAVGAIAGETDMFPPEMLSDMCGPYLTKTAADVWIVVENTSVEVNSGIVGFAYAAPEKFTDRTWNLLCIAVLPQYRGKGCGSMLIRAVEAHLSLAGQRLLLVETQSTDDFQSQRQFYAKMGFTAQGTIQDYYGDGVGKSIFAKRISTATAPTES